MLQASMPSAYINAIGTAVPVHDVHDKFVQFAPLLLTDERLRKLFRRMADRCQIEHRYSFFAPTPIQRYWTPAASSRAAVLPDTATRMKFYERPRPGPRNGEPGRRRQSEARTGDHPPDRDLLHRLLCARPGPATGAPAGAGPVRRAHHHRLHGLLRRDERAEAGPPHRPLGAAGPRSPSSTWSDAPCTSRRPTTSRKS